MAKRSKIAQQAYDIALPVAEEQGVDLIDCEYKKEGQKLFLRLYIDKRGGVTLDDCEKFHNAVEPLIDEGTDADEDFFEVSSPGLTRPLTELSDYVRYEGEQLDVTRYVEPKKFTAGYKVTGDKIEFDNGVTCGLEDIAKAVRHLDY